MSKFQVVKQELVAEIGLKTHVLWDGDQIPTEIEVDNIKQQSTTLFLESDQPRQAMRQEINDYILVRKQRTPRFLGWTTIRSVNLYE